MEDLLDKSFLATEAKVPFWLSDRMIFARALPSLRSRSLVSLSQRSPLRKCFATVASASDYNEVMDIVKWEYHSISMRRKRSIDYYYAGCMIPECMKVPFFVAVRTSRFRFPLAMLQHRSGRREGSHKRQCDCWKDATAVVTRRDQRALREAGSGSNSDVEVPVSDD